MSSHPTTSALPSGPPPDRARALRRMVTGLSLAACLFGLLLIVGMLALDLAGLAWLGALPLTAGLAGFFAVLWRLPWSLREHDDAPRLPRRTARWFWAPAGVALLGAACVALAMMMPQIHAGEDATMIRNHVVIWLEIALVLLIVTAVLIGLILLGMWTTPDDDDHTILRRTDYAQRRREGRHPGERGPDSPYYDPDWVRGHRDDSHRP